MIDESKVLVIFDKICFKPRRWTTARCIYRRDSILPRLAQQCPTSNTPIQKQPANYTQTDQEIDHKKTWFTYNFGAIQRLSSQLLQFKIGSRNKDQPKKKKERETQKKSKFRYQLFQMFDIIVSPHLFIKARWQNALYLHIHYYYCTSLKKRWRQYTKLAWFSWSDNTKVSAGSTLAIACITPTFAVNENLEICMYLWNNRTYRHNKIQTTMLLRVQSY